MVMVAGKGPSGMQLRLTYQERGLPAVMDEVSIGRNSTH